MLFVKTTSLKKSKTEGKIQASKFCSEGKNAQSPAKFDSTYKITNQQLIRQVKKANCFRTFSFAIFERNLSSRLSQTNIAQRSQICRAGKL